MEFLFKNVNITVLGLHQNIFLRECLQQYDLAVVTNRNHLLALVVIGSDLIKDSHDSAALTSDMQPSTIVYFQQGILAGGCRRPAVFVEFHPSANCDSPIHSMAPISRLVVWQVVP